MNNKYKLLIWILFAVQIINAQESRTLTLSDAINFTITNSKLLKLNQEKIQAASIKIKEAEEYKLPEATASATYMFLPIKPNVKLKFGSSGNQSPTIHNVMFTNIAGSLPIYTAGKIQYGIESAQYLKKAIELDSENDKSNIIMNVTQACINLFKAYTAITLVKENLASANQRVKDFTNLEKNGVLARNDLMKAELQSSNIELTLLDVESNYKIACVNMNLMMGLKEETILIPDRNGLALPQTIKTINEYEQDALQNRKDIAAIEERKKAAMTGVKLAIADKYPTVALTGGYVAADIPKMLSLYNAINFGIGIRYNIASLWKNKTKVAAAQILVNEVNANQELLNDNIKLQINQAYEAYIVSTKKIEVYEKAIEQATENYRIINNKYNNSLATTTELLEADVALLQTKLSVTNAKADSFLAYNKILQVAGLLKN